LHRRSPTASPRARPKKVAGRFIPGRGAIIGLDSFAPRLHLSAMSLPTLAAGFIARCLPTKTDKLPSGGQWLHEIKHDGFRIIGGRVEGRGRFTSRPGRALPRRFPLIVDTVSTRHPLP